MVVSFIGGGNRSTQRKPLHFQILVHTLNDDSLFQTSQGAWVAALLRLLLKKTTDLLQITDKSYHKMLYLLLIKDACLQIHIL